MKRIRILIAEMPRMLREIVEDVISDQPDLEIVRTVDVRDLSAAIGHDRPDVVIVADADDDGGRVHERTCVEHPRVKFIVVTEDGRQAEALEFRRLPVPDLSPRRLLDVIRTVAGRGHL